MKSILNMALLASTLMAAPSALGKTSEPPRKSDPPRKAEPIHCRLTKVARGLFDGCPNEAELCSELIRRHLVQTTARDFSPVYDGGYNRVALESCLVKFEREVLGN